MQVEFIVPKDDMKEVSVQVWFLLPEDDTEEVDGGPAGEEGGDCHDRGGLIRVPHRHTHLHT